ncbi:hypothetical protein ElyMa_000422300 [Elysia marginata]|uniref:Uncharacterized protein n=1 Tax=Elysia marginata TaxID=1093978 RepID=A0AAV4FN22_9GAST|nr:hypothetical protein ElyMa_000422300 [Elysia marginata]
MQVTAGVTACGQRRPVSSTRSLNETRCVCLRSLVSPGRGEDPHPQQPSGAKRTSGYQDRQLTRTARWTEATTKQRCAEVTSTAKVG